MPIIEMMECKYRFIQPQNPHFFLKFIYLRERERECAHARSGRGRGAWGEQEIRSGLCADSREPDAGLELMNREIMA